ncbi:hypothetical protein [Rothia nasisuis]|uniref:hypothetical protein n=1 Tax=Rothia nasisuis TaxID=2109647 RepID=UPI001F31458E|nr:hypothetical protein [Rothia nasisuis]
MAKKKVTVVSALAATALLAGCAQTIVPGMSIEKTDGWGGREDITIEVTAEHNGTGAPAKVTVYQDQMSFDGNQAEFEGEALYKLNYDNLTDLSDSQIRVSVSAQDPAAEVFCAIKGTGYSLEEGDHVNHANEADGTGSATCVLNVD